jgi:trans-2-enoyl-CoA reductase
MMINPCTALRMLLDFVPLAPGDWVIQNSANSGVGQAVIQIAKTMGVKTVNVVRDRKDIEQMKEKLTNMGGTIIFTEEELRATQMWKSGEVIRPVLGFNCVGGPSSTEICKALADKGVHVTYGGMSRKPVMAATSHMIFKDLELRGFWMGQWNDRQGTSKARMDMYSHITQLVYEGQLDPPDHKFVTLDNYREALDNTLKGFLPAKYVFKID